MRVLIVDDSRAMRSLISYMVKELGFDVLEAKNGSEALEQLKHNKGSVELALVDWNMPHMNGYEFVKAVRSESCYDALKIMMVTTETDLSQVTKAIDAGANEYLMKPFSKEMLLDKINLFGLA